MIGASMQITQPKSPETPIHPIFDRPGYRRFEAWLGSLSPLGNTPIFSTDVFPWAVNLEKNWTEIRKELDQVLMDVSTLPSFQDIMPRQNRISPDNKWKTYYFCAFGFVASKNCDQCPKTWALIKDIPGLKVAFFSILAPGKHIPEHRGKHKGLIRYHLGLRVPEPKEQCRIRVDKAITHWEEGKSLIFDDTYYHEVWNDTDGYRVVLFLDIERPFKFPLSWVNAAVSKMLTLSPQVKQAQENYEKFGQ